MIDKYYETLTEDKREKLFAEMRRINEKADRFNTQHKRLSPDYGKIPVGGAHMEPFFQYEAASNFLRCLRNGSTPFQAAEFAKYEAAKAIKKWNSSRKDYQIHRWPQAMDFVIDGYLRSVLESVS